MNPARSLAPAVFSGGISDLWIYIVAPVAAQQSASSRIRQSHESCLCLH